MDCNVRFVPDQAKAAKEERLEEDMKRAASEMEFDRAQALKQELQVLRQTKAGPVPPPETWLFQGGQFPNFGKLLTNRGVEPQDVEIACEDTSNGPASWGSRPCKECLRLSSGGPYGKFGVLTPAYPAQEQAQGCLALTKALDVDLSEYEGVKDGAMGDDSYDASSSPTNVAFCRV